MATDALGERKSIFHGGVGGVSTLGADTLVTLSRSVEGVDSRCPAQCPGACLLNASVFGTPGPDHPPFM